MRLPTPHDTCGPLLELGQIQRQLKLGAPVDKGTTMILPMADELEGTEADSSPTAR